MNDCNGIFSKHCLHTMCKTLYIWGNAHYRKLKICAANSRMKGLKYKHMSRIEL